MSEPIKTKEELMSAVSQTLTEVKEILKKSGIDMPMRKDGESEPDEIAGQASADAAAPTGEPGPDAAADAAVGGEPDMDPAGAPAPDAGAAPAPGAEGGEGEGDMAEHAKQLSDEELGMMLEVLMSEKERRGAGAEGAAPPAAPGGAPAGAPPMAPGPEMAGKSMKSEFSGLAKSLAEIASSVKSLATEVEGLKKSAAVAATKKPVVTTKPVATGDVQVLNKSQEAVQRLNKSETIEFLYNLQKSGDKMVNSSVISDVNSCQTEAELTLVQKRLTKSGIKFPVV